MARVVSSSREMELLVDLESGRRDTSASPVVVGVSSLQDAQRLLDRLWGGGDSNGCAASAAAAAGRNRPAGSSSLGLVRSHSVTIPNSCAAAGFGGGAYEDGEPGSLPSPTTSENNKSDGSVGGGGGGGEKQRRQKSPNSRRPPKPPRPPRAPSLDAADLKLVKEMSELAMLRRARMERLRAIRKMRAAASNASSTNNTSSLLAFVVTLFFCVVIVWQGLCSRNGSSTSRFEGSPVSSLRAGGGGLISVHYFKNRTSEAYISSSASPKVEQASGWG